MIQNVDVVDFAVTTIIIYLMAHQNGSMRTMKTNFLWRKKINYVKKRKSFDNDDIDRVEKENEKRELRTISFDGVDGIVYDDDDYDDDSPFHYNYINSN